MLARKPLRASSGCCAPSPLILTAHFTLFRSLEKALLVCVLALQLRKAEASGCCARSRTTFDRSAFSPARPRLRPGALAQSWLPFSLGKALALGASDNRPVIRSGFQGRRLAIKPQAFALKPPLGSLDIMGCIMSPCLLAKTLIALFFGPAGSLPICPQGLPEEQLKEKAYKPRLFL